MKYDISASALIIVDVQNDFCPGGALPIRSGDGIIDALNDRARYFARHDAPVVVTQDWHPEDHCSFKEYGGLWSAHCVRGSAGAELHPRLDIKPVSLIIKKGRRKNTDSYSAFFENDKKTTTGLFGYLSALGIQNVYIGGLALEYCVLFSALDAASLGFRVFVINDAVRAARFSPDSEYKAREELNKAGILFI